MPEARIENHADMIWGVAELLRGDYKRSEYGRVILPLAVLRRLDQALADSKQAVLKQAREFESAGVKNVDLALRKVANRQFYNRSPLDFDRLTDDPGNVADHLRSYIKGFSPLAREAIDKFEFDTHIDRLNRSNLLYQVIARISQVDLHPERVSNVEMGYIFEELIRRFAEQSNETAGEHFTPREVVRLMVNLLFDGDEQALRERGAIRTVFDCACGTGGMLSEAELQIRHLNERTEVRLYGQELNPESYGICLADMLVKEQDASHIVFGNSLADDGHQGGRFHYCIANPPFGVDWKKVEKEVREEYEYLGDDGRFGPGLPPVTDGQLLFQLHLLSKMRDPERGGTRIAIVHNGSPLFSGAAGSGPSEIRRHVLENDWLEAIIAMPEQIFYNTGIATYVWLLSNRKPPKRAGKVQLVDARDLWTPMKKSLGEKRRYLSETQIEEITKLHGDFTEGERARVIPVEKFGYRTVVVEQPLRARFEISASTWDEVEEERTVVKLKSASREEVVQALGGLTGESFSDEAGAKSRIKEVLRDHVTRPPAALVNALARRTIVRDSEAEIVRDRKGDPVPDPLLRDSENVPLTEDVAEYLRREVHPHVPDAWIPDPEGKIGYEIPFTRLFFKSASPRPSGELQAELLELKTKIDTLLEEVVN